MSAAEVPDNHDIVITVATYRRPDGLRRLIGSLNAMTLPADPHRVRLVVVDNDPQRPCVEDSAELSALSRWPVTYISEPRRGVVSARNRALKVIPPDAGIVAFLDDDETVDPQWLLAMLATLQETGADAVQGPVVPIYETPPPAWVERLAYFSLGPYRQGEPLSFASTNNSCIRASVLRRLALRFDADFNESGGEDEDFYQRLLRAGGNIAAAAEARVFDVVPAHRMTIRWHLLRARRKGNTLGRIALKLRHGRAIRLIKGLSQIGVGAITAGTLGLWSMTPRMRGLTDMARGVGTVQAYLRMEVLEYSAQALRKDRLSREEVSK